MKKTRGQKSRDRVPLSNTFEYLADFQGISEKYCRTAVKFKIAISWVIKNILACMELLLCIQEGCVADPDLFGRIRIRTSVTGSESGSWPL
jgi:hypothetical protein